jgi:hypothetical protein
MRDPLPRVANPVAQVDHTDEQGPTDEIRQQIAEIHGGVNDQAVHLDESAIRASRRSEVHVVSSYRATITAAIRRTRENRVRSKNTSAASRTQEARTRMRARRS